MGNTQVGRFSPMARVAAIIVVIIVIIAAVFFGLFDKDKPKAEAAPTEPASVYPERGVAANITGEGNKLSCDTKVVASVKLADDQGTVSHNGTKITSKWDKDSVLITFDGDMVYGSGYVVGARNTEPFNIPDNIQVKNSPGIVLKTTDFSESGQFIDIFLCGGGM